MADARAYSANFASVQAVALEAMQRPDGLSVTFLVRDLGSIAACLHKARSFQQSFTSLRARSRRLSAAMLGESSTIPPRDSFAHGPLDNLACYREVLPDNEGWRVILVNSQRVIESMNIIDNATGLPLSEIGKGASEDNKLIDKMARCGRKDSIETWTSEDAMRLSELRPDLEKVAHLALEREFKRHMSRHSPGPFPGEQRDIADLSEEELGFALPEEGEKQTP